MNPIAAQQVALDNALVAPDNRVQIGQCNMRIDPTKVPKEPNYQVILNSLALSPLYPAFLITAKICPRLPNQEFDAPPSDEESVTFIKELGHKGDIKYATDVVVDQIHQLWRTFASIINKCLSGKITSLDFVFKINKRDHKKQEKIILGTLKFVSKSDEYQVYGALLPKGMPNQQMQDSPAYNTYLAFVTGAATPKKARKFKKLASPSKKKALVDVEEPVEKHKKAPAKAERSNGIELLSDAALLKQSQLKKAIKRSKRETYIHQVDSDDNDDDYQQSDVERIKSDDDDKIADINKTDDEEDDNDVNVELKDSEFEDEGKENKEMTNIGYVEAEHEEVSHEVAGDQVKDDAQTTVLAALATEVPLQSSFISSDYASKYLNFSNIPPVDTKIILMIDIKVQHENLNLIKEHSVPADVVEKLKQQYKPQKSVVDIRKIKIEHTKKQQEPKYTIVSSNMDALWEFDQKRTLFETMTKTKSFEQRSKHKALYHALMESILEDEDAMDKGVSDKSKKRKPNDADKYEGPAARSDQGLKRKKTSKEPEPSKKAKSTGTSKGNTKSHPKYTGKSEQAEETVFEAEDSQGPQNPKDDMDNTDEPPIVPVDYFFNNDLAYLQGESTVRTYTTSLTKTKAAKYDLKGIEDMNRHFNLEGDVIVHFVAALRFNTAVGNHVKKILLKLILPDYKSVLMDSKAKVKAVRDAAAVGHANHKSSTDPRRWPAIKVLPRRLYALPRPQVPKWVAIRTSSSRAAVGAREATSEGITGELGEDFRKHSGDTDVPTGDGGVWTGVGETLIGERTGVSSSSEPVPSSSNSILSVFVSAISLEVPRYLFHTGRVGDDAGDDDDKWGSSREGVNTGEPQALQVDEMVYVSVGADEEDIDM
uniref:Uncharacterized protein n=1 Tax=Tanacetum cinerariifolium TaxID=118510 RepID=A0A6L2J3C4_TANCI|nr:hypothetical protein [Tanacetum cinerariifolium]